MLFLFIYNIIIFLEKYYLPITPWTTNKNLVASFMTNQSLSLVKFMLVQKFKRSARIACTCHYQSWRIGTQYLV